MVPAIAEIGALWAAEEVRRAEGQRAAAVQERERIKAQRLADHHKALAEDLTKMATS